MRRALALLILWAIALFASDALGQKIAIARTAGDQRIANRVNAELSALGFEVELVDPVQSNELRTLERIATEHEAVAGLRASPSKTGIELWIADPATGATAFEEVVTVASGRNDELLALRAVEVLRARLLKLGVHSDPSPPPNSPSPSPSPPSPPEYQLVQQNEVPLAPALEPSPARLWADLGLSYTYSGGPLSNNESARLGATLAPDPRWSVAGFALLPIRTAEVSTDLGTARLGATLFALALDGYFERQWLQGSFGAGTALALLRVRGEASAPYQGQSESLATALPFLRLGVAASLTSQLRLRAELLAGLSAPATILRIADSEAATWGRPLLVGSLSLQLGAISWR